MAKSITQARLYHLIQSLDWQGHFELGDQDMYWLAGAIAAKLARGDLQQCVLCEESKEVVVQTAAGPICEACIDDAQTVARETRELLEEEDE